MILIILNIHGDPYIYGPRRADGVTEKPSVFMLSCFTKAKYPTRGPEYIALCIAHYFYEVNCYGLYSVLDS